MFINHYTECKKKIALHLTEIGVCMLASLSFPKPHYFSFLRKSRNFQPMGQDLF